MSDLSGRPIYVVNERTKRVDNEGALAMNVDAMTAIAEMIKTTLGPKGMNKMLVDGMGEVSITNDGSKILEEIQTEHPAAKMIIDLSKSIKKNSGDGVSSAVIFSGDLMKRVQEMIKMDISPVYIYKGFSHALKELKEILDHSAIPIDIKERKTLENCIETALNSKLLSDGKILFSKISVDAILKIKEERSNGISIDIDNIQIIKKQGEGLMDSKLIDGIVVDKEVINAMMPKTITNAKIALVDGALEIVKTEVSSEIQIRNPNEISSYLKKEEEILKDYVDAIHSSGANVVFCQKGVDETAQHFLSKYGIMAIRRVKHSDMEKLSRSTGAKIVTKIKTISESDLGNAEIVSEKKIGKDYMIFVEKCKEPKSVTVMIRGGTEHIVDDAERALKNGLSVAKSIIENPKVIGGAGSIEMELSKNLMDFARKVGGKEQIAIENYAQSIESIPKTLVENAGKDPLDIITDLRAKVDYSKKKYNGYDAYSDSIVNVINKGIIEPVSIKKQIFTLATELVILFTRIDDIIKSHNKSSKNSPGMN